ncbi:MAG TPA: PHP domain-containing protein, partial [Dehalococcoidia bacterium]|nr:PHP domain-containing protein [Dehalococcoidia bacterium]
MNYVELHCHSNYSFQEGASSVEELLARAKELGYPALALTDHNNLCGAMHFAQAAKGFGIHPITGAEITLTDGSHLTLLAKDRQGYRNLSNLITYSHINDRLHPAMEPRHLADHSRGLILLTGCPQGRLPTLIAQGQRKEARTLLEDYLEWFGTSNVFVELQQRLVFGDIHRNRQLSELAGESGVGVVATNSVHYHVPDRHRLQDALVSIRHNKSLEETHRQRRVNGQFYLKSYDEMAVLFKSRPDALANTLKIANRCAFDLTSDLGYQFPEYPVPPGYTPLSYLRHLCHQAAVRRYGGFHQQVRARLEEEFRLIEKHGLAGFFLVYYEIVKMAHEIMVKLSRTDLEIPPEERAVLRGRGSSVAMVVCYLIGLSHIDPLKYNLSLERFISDDMGSVPDIDLDFPRDIREEIIKRVHQKWGWDCAALTGTIVTYNMKGAVRDLGKALGLPQQDLD